MLFNLSTGAWDEELLRILDIPVSLMPTVASSSEVYGQTATEWFGTSVPVPESLETSKPRYSVKTADDMEWPEYLRLPAASC